MRRIEFLKLALTICILVVTAQVIASPYPEEGEPPTPPTPYSQITCKYVYITHPDCSIDEDFEVTEEFTSDISVAVQEFLSDQTDSLYTFSISAIADVFSIPPVYSWEADHDTSFYLANFDTMYYFREGYAKNAVGVVNAEIVTKIYNKYKSEGESTPLLDADYVFFIYGCQMWNGYAGKATTELTNLLVTENKMHSAKGFYTSRDCGYRDLPETLKFISGHEFGHAFISFPHSTDESTTTHGAYALMRPSVLNSWSNTGPGLIPYCAKNKYDKGWLDGTVVTEEGRYILYDSQSDNRNTIVVPLANLGGLYEDERFILSYHKGTGYDERYPSMGLQIWHNRYAGFNDIEVASGRWNWDSGDTSFTIANPISGVDALDREYQYQLGMSDYNFSGNLAGFPEDFFAVDDIVKNPNGVEFSYRTNPSTWGSEGNNLAAPNSVQTTLYIRAFPRNSKSIFVDVYPMPRPEIVSPVAGDIGGVGNSTPVIWDSFFWESGPDSINVLDEVQIWFSPHNGLPNSYLQVGTANFPDTTFSWVPGGEFVTEQGKVKLVFDNVVNDNVSETVMDGTMTILGAAVPWEAIASPNGNEALFVDVSHEISWTTFVETDTTKVNIHLSLDGGSNWQLIANDADYQSKDDISYYNWAPTSDFIGEQARIKLEFTFINGCLWEYSEDISEEDFSIYPLGATFDDVTVASGVDYSGTPYSAVSLEYTSDYKLDMFVTIQTDSSTTPSKLYKNIRDEFNPIKFADRTGDDFLLGSQARKASHGLSVADFDNDNAPDIFVTHTEYPQLFKWENNMFRDVITDRDYFNQDDHSLLQNSYCVNWVDFDHDGDLDFYLGRATIGEPGGGNKTPLFNTLFENRGSSVSFGEVGRNIGLVDEANATVTVSAAWADCDGDNLWEVAVGDFVSPGQGGGPTRLYTQNLDQSFSLEVMPFPATIETDLVNSLEWVDIDQDSDLDLLLIRSASQSYIALNNQGQLSGEIMISGQGDWISSSGCSWDFNLDGYPDFLLGNETGNSPPRLLENLLGYDTITHHTLYDVAPEVGLTSNLSSVQGILASDFNDDGDLDLFLGRESLTSGRVFQNQQLDGTDDPANNYLSVILSSPNGVNNTMGIGSVVRLYADGLTEPVGTQHVDGGSGRGGQAGNTLVFGLGSYSSPDKLVVNWPNGFQQEITGLQLGGPTPILDLSEISIPPSSVSGLYHVVPNSSSANLIFEWDTNIATPPWKDEVTVLNTSCFGREVPLTSNSPNVESSVSRNLDGSYHHVFKWNNQPCIPACVVDFKVLSGAGDSAGGNAIETESSQNSFSISVCGKPYIPSQ